MKPVRTIVSIALLMSMLAGCADTTADIQNTDVTTTEGESNAVEPTALEKRQSAEDSLPSDLNFQGADVNILTRAESPFNYEMGVSEEIGEVVNDAIYQRNITVEERLNVSINIDASAEGNATTNIRTAVLSGDDMYTICTGTSFHTPALVLEGCFVDLNTVEYLDFDKPWWIQNLREEITLYDQLYFMAGDMTLSLLQLESAIFANQKLLHDYGIDEDLYSLVREGKWTLDKLSELSQKVSGDLNGDGIINESDQFGLGVVDGTRIMALGYGAGMVITEKDENGIPQLAMDSEHTYDIFEKVNSLLWSNTSFTTFNGTISNKGTETDSIALMQKMFIGDQILFYTGNIMDTEVFREMQSDYCILPFPKFDENQADYISYSRDTFTVVVIPVTCQNTELAGAVCEAMAAESYRCVTPAYFDVALKGKYSRDELSAEMIDLVHSSISFNWGLANSYSMDYVSHIFQNAIENGEGFASRYATKKSAVEAGYEKLIEYYKAGQ